MEEFNSGPPKTNPSSGREEDLNLGPPDNKSLTWYVKMFVRDSIDPGTDPTEINGEYINLPQLVNVVKPL